MADVHKDANGSFASLDADNMIDVPIGDTSSVSSNGTFHYHMGSFSPVTQRSKKPYLSSPSSPIPGQSQGRGLGIRISSRPSDLMLTAMSQKNSVTAPPTAASTPAVNHVAGRSASDSSDSFPDQHDTSVSSTTSVSTTGGRTAEELSISRSSFLDSQTSVVSTSSVLDTPSNTRSMPTLSGNSQSTIVTSPPRCAPPQWNGAAAECRRRLQQQQRKSLTKAEKDKLYDEDNDEITGPSQMYNVPVANGSTASLFSSFNNRHSQTILRKAWAEAPNNVLSPSPLPGNLETNRASVFSEGGASTSPALSTSSSFSNMSPVAQQLSNFYEYSLQSHADDEFNRRLKQVDSKIGVDQLQLQDLKVDDYRMISQEKLNMLTPTRPVWLPPKNSAEASKQEHDFKRMIKHEGSRMQKESHRKQRIERDRTIGDARLEYLAGKESLTSSNVHEVKKLLWISQVSPAIRMTLFTKVLTYSYNVTSEQLNKLPSIHIASAASLDSINSMVDSTLHSYDDPKLISALGSLLKRTMPNKDWQYNSCKIALSLLSGGFNNNDSLRVLHYVNDYVVDKKFVAKFNNNITTSRTMATYGKHFMDDLNAINMTNFVRLLNCLSDPIVYKLTNLLVIYADYKLLHAFLLTILLHYHFGWNNVQLLLSGRRDNLIRIDNEDLFWSRVYGTYKKFKTFAH